MPLATDSHLSTFISDLGAASDQASLYLQGTPTGEQQDQLAAPQQAEHSPRLDNDPSLDPSTSAQAPPLSETSAAAHATSASGMSLQPPSLPSHFSDARQQHEQQQQQQMSHAQLMAQAQQQAAAGSPREGGADPKQAAPKPPLAPGSKTLPQVP